MAWKFVSLACAILESALNGPSWVIVIILLACHGIYRLMCDLNVGEICVQAILIIDKLTELLLDFILWLPISPQLENELRCRLNERYGPTASPKVRKRSLSNLEMNLQQKSLFFQMLPLEVRLIIYNFVIVNGSNCRNIRFKEIDGRYRLWNCQRGLRSGDN